ncbi:MAG TPA: hypothetical protein VFT29_02110 [Gemmatimonadaceae bacterium]|nr:hypothetical protein [Gemmatimonadaceae bacterium]
MRRPAAGALAVVLSVNACIPVNIIEPASPPLVGMLTNEDGTPAVRVSVGVNGEYGDQGCEHISRRTFTDSAGVFRLDPTTHKVKWAVIIPPVERFFSSYSLCASFEDTAPVFAYHGSIPRRGQQKPDTVQCVAWTWQQRRRMTCASQFPTGGQHRIEVGGRWQDERSNTGNYRLIVARNDSYGRPAVFLQWIEYPASGPASVPQTVNLPLIPRMIALTEAGLLADKYSRPSIVLRSVGDPRWNQLRQPKECSLFELGPPGEFRQSPCPQP